MIIAGIDEAGRGPCIGPLVLAITCIHKQDEEKLTKIGVKDSKLLSESQRNGLYEKIFSIASEVNSTKLSAKEIDSLLDFKSLNELEAMKVGFLLNSLKEKPELVLVDSPDIIADNFAKRINKYVSFKAKIIAEHKADVNYPVVSAASVIAKVNRDNAIKEFEKVYGKIGSGYPHDQQTISFLRNFLHQKNYLPDIVRKSWITTQKIVDEKFQQKLFE